MPRVDGVTLETTAAGYEARLRPAGTTWHIDQDGRVWGTVEGAQ